MATTDSDSDDNYTPQANALVSCAAVAVGAVAADTAATATPAAASVATAPVTADTTAAAANIAINLIANMTPDMSQAKVMRVFVASGSTVPKDAVSTLDVINGMRVEAGLRAFAPQTQAPPTQPPPPPTRRHHRRHPWSAC